MKVTMEIWEIEQLVENTFAAAYSLGKIHGDREANVINEDNNISIRERKDRVAEVRAHCETKAAAQETARG